MNNQPYLFDISEFKSEPEPKPRPHKDLKRKIKSPNREQVKFTSQSLDESIPLNHQARTVWNFVELLDFTEFYKEFYSLDKGVGRAIVDLRILTALWIYAISDGVVSGRKIAKYCIENKAYAWICGGVPVSHHLLSQFRSNFSSQFESFVVQTIAALSKEELITIKRVSQDGTKIQASASGSSMRRKKTLISGALEIRKHIKDLEKQLLTGELNKEEIKRKKRELNEEKAKKEKLIKAAQELNKHKEKLNKNKKKNRQKLLSNKAVSELRASSTDPECRKMKIPNHGFKPAYNVQIVTDVDTELVLKTSIYQSSSDGGQLKPMYSSLKSIYDFDIDAYLVDAGYRNKEDFQTLFNDGCLVYSPSKKQKTAALRKRVLEGNLKNDTEADQEWIKRMETEEANELYNHRIRSSETINAFLANHGIKQFLVRGVEKVKGLIDLACLAYNVQIINRLYNII